MFASISERKMRTTQATLFAGWLLLIFSLLWDPATPALTHPQALGSPFHIKDAGVMLQGEPLLNTPYAMGARIWWTMLVPILPLFLMVFGHEAWRRICPLSFASQLPRRLGFNRKRAVLQRRTGKVEHTIVVVKRNGWLQRNAWYVQGGLLVLGLSARLVLVNSDRISLAVFLLGIIASSVVVGYLYGGKTWCNYICPVNVVQKIYTEPRGLLESAPHLTRPPIPQSMCRTPTAAGDTSACVGCTNSCGDIDLEKSYWDSIANPQRRHVYYGFFGLIVGFYGYYYLYSGAWDYYFSGIWTHETGTLSRVFGPGLFIKGTAIALPKIIAAPLTLLIAGALALGLGLGLEHLYRRTRAVNRRISEPEIVHHCLCFSAFLSINTFYLFGGRPNLMLLPPTATRILDIVIVALTTLWFLQAVQRTPFRFRRESMASSLLLQLKRLKVDVSKYLEGRTLDELKPDEVYVLTKVLPAFTHEQKLAAYRQILDDAIATGKTKSTLSLSLLHEMRMQMDISDEEHAQLIEQLRAAPPGGHELQLTASHEKWDSLKSYTEILGDALAAHVEAGRTLDEALDEPQLASTIAILRASFQISEVEHTAVLGNIVSAGGVLMTRVAHHLAALGDLLAARFCMHSYSMTGARPRAIGTLLTSAIEQRVRSSCLTLLSLLRAVGDSAEARWSAYSLCALSGEGARALLRQPATGDADGSWEQALSPALASMLRGDDNHALLPQAPEGLRVYSFREVIAAGIDIRRNLERLADDTDPLVLALVLSALQEFRPTTARGLAENFRSQNTPPSHWMLEEVVASILGDATATQARPATGVGNGDFAVEPIDAVTRMLWLSRCGEIAALPLTVLAELAGCAQARRYHGNVMLCHKGQPLDQVFILRSGILLREEQSDATGTADPVCDELIGEFSAGRVHDGIRVLSPDAQVLAIPVNERTTTLLAETDFLTLQPKFTDDVTAAPDRVLTD